MIKSISFIVLTQYFHFNELRHPGYLIFYDFYNIFLQCIIICINYLSRLIIVVW